MGCEQWSGQLEAYVDGELDAPAVTAVVSHLRQCSACASAALECAQMKRSVASAGKRYEPDAAFRKKIGQSISPVRRTRIRIWQLALAPALLLLVVALTTNLHVTRDRGRQQSVYSELADLHVSTLASATPVDVVSTDRHTVKPWFEGRIPFTFNLPELQDSEFSLLGGRVTYLAQTPGAHLIYKIRKHEVSVFIFQDRGPEIANLPSAAAVLSFHATSWTQNGLRYFVIGDVNSGDIGALTKLLRDAD